MAAFCIQDMAFIIWLGHSLLVLIPPHPLLCHLCLLVQSCVQSYVFLESPLDTTQYASFFAIIALNLYSFTCNVFIFTHMYRGLCKKAHYRGSTLVLLCLFVCEHYLQPGLHVITTSSSGTFELR